VVDEGRNVMVFCGGTGGMESEYRLPTATNDCKPKTVTSSSCIYCSSTRHPHIQYLHVPVYSPRKQQNTTAKGILDV